jgi:hypothetical protein
MTDAALMHGVITELTSDRAARVTNADATLRDGIVTLTGQQGLVRIGNGITIQRRPKASDLVRQIDKMHVAWPHMGSDAVRNIVLRANHPMLKLSRPLGFRQESEPKDYETVRTLRSFEGGTEQVGG